MPSCMNVVTRIEPTGYQPDIDSLKAIGILWNLKTICCSAKDVEKLEKVMFEKSNTTTFKH